MTRELDGVRNGGSFEARGATVFAAVFASVPAGHHAVWVGHGARIEIDVAGGQVTEVALG
ncbi:MAG: hypothetical protein JOZ68_11845 [Acidimicrobiia bacterium]|nr:hypothetical protein [Acidimicrobiia bacterium]